MRIAILASKLNIHGGGSNRSLSLLATALSERGHDVSVATINSDENALPDNPPYATLELVDSDARTRAGKTAAVSRAIERYAPTPDLIHLFSPLYLTAAGHARKRLDVPIVARLNTYNPFCVNTNRMTTSCYHDCDVGAKFRHQDVSTLKRVAKVPFYVSRTYVEPAYWKNLDGYFALSPAVEDVYATFGIPPDRMHVIPNFPDPSFTGDGRADSEQRSERLKLFYVGRLEPAKGIDLLLMALARTDDVDLTIAGDGTHRDRLQHGSRRLGLAQRVDFLGRVPNDSLPSLYASADLFVHPARWPEPFGRTLLEALEMGTPCLVADAGGPPWVVGDAGLTFRPDDVDDLARAIERLRDDRALISRLAEHCQHELGRFEAESVISAVETRYREVCA